VNIRLHLIFCARSLGFCDSFEPLALIACESAGHHPGAVRKNGG
jgi:hypothetical protein